MWSWLGHLNQAQIWFVLLVLTVAVVMPIGIRNWKRALRDEPKAKEKAR